MIIQGLIIVVTLATTATLAFVSRNSESPTLRWLFNICLALSLLLILYTGVTGIVSSRELAALQQQSTSISNTVAEVAVAQKRIKVEALFESAWQDEKQGEYPTAVANYLGGICVMLETPIERRDILTVERLSRQACVNMSHHITKDMLGVQYDIAVRYTHATNLLAQQPDIGEFQLCRQELKMCYEKAIARSQQEN